MSYYRKQYDKKKLKRLAEETPHCYPAGSYFDEEKGYYVRMYKSKCSTSFWTTCKKEARQKVRRYAKYNDVYTKKIYDLWWKVF